VFYLNRAVILAGARTAFGKFGGSLSAVHASDLGATAIKGALEKSNVRLDDKGDRGKFLLDKRQ